MNRPDEQHTGEGYAQVSVVDSHTISCVLKGYITGDTVKQSMHETNELVQQLRRHGAGKVYLLLDIRGVTGEDSGARTGAKQLRSFNLDRIAVFGGSSAVTLVGQYIARAAGLAGSTRFFRSRTAARTWLRRPHDVPVDPGRGLRVTVGLVMVLIGAIVLLGWAVGSQELQSVFPGLNAMNPMTATTMIGLGTVLALFRKTGMGRRRQYVLLGVAVWCVLFGLSGVLRAAGVADLQLDRLLFPDRLMVSQYGGRLSLMAALCFAATGAMLAMALSSQKQRWQQYVFHLSSVFVFASALVAVVGYSFGIERLYSLGFAVPMALNTAICFLLLNHALQTTMTPLAFFARAQHKFTVYWPAYVVSFAVLLLTGVAWQQSSLALEQRSATALSQQAASGRDLVTDRVNAYTNALRGYKAFFESSTDVDVNEFHAYFASSQLSQQYPGFSAITFIRAVPAAQKQQFISQVRQSAGSLRPSYQTYNVQPLSANPILYPLVYSEPAGTGSGLDLSTDAERLLTLEKARDLGEPVASGSINLNLSRPELPERPGFLVTIPIYSQTTASGVPQSVNDRRVRSYGFVNAVFEDKTLFTDIFGDAPDDTVRFEVIDDSTGKELFVHNAEEAPGVTVPQKVSTIDVAGQRWRVALFTPAHYGQEGLERYYPLAILVGGGMLAALGGGFLVIQARRREHALDLAGAMTEDLNNERNMAVATQQKDEAILSSIGDAVFAIDMDGHITLFNPVAERLSGWRRADAIGRPYKDVLHFELESTGKVSDDFIRRALAGHPAAMNRHTILVRKDGKRIAVADSAAPIRDADDRILGVIVIFRDVSKEQELDRAKSEFVSLASHQLRTPLSAIKWYGEMLLSGDSGKLNPEQQEHVQEVFDGNERMIELVNSLLDVSRLDLGKLTNEPTPTVLADVADSLAKELATAIAGKQLQFKMDIDRKMAPVVADPKLLRMVLQNLMSNAVKYTPPKGSVTVTVRLAKHAEVVKSGSRSEAPHIYIAVTDTGYGIPKAQQYKIFGKLFRADNVRAMDVEGTGLGLYIVKQVAQKLGGDVWFHSVENAGTTFHLVFPVDTRRRKS